MLFNIEGINNKRRSDNEQIKKAGSNPGSLLFFDLKKSSLSQGFDHLFMDMNIKLGTHIMRPIYWIINPIISHLLIIR